MKVRAWMDGEGASKIGLPERASIVILRTCDGCSSPLSSQIRTTFAGTLVLGETKLGTTLACGSLSGKSAEPLGQPFSLQQLTITHHLMRYISLGVE